MELDLLMYSLLIIFYLIFFVFLFVEKMEGTMIIILFILSTFSGYKLLYDMKTNEMLNIDIDPIRNTYSFLFNFLKKFGSIGVMIVFLILFAASYTLHYFSYIPRWGFSLSAVLLSLSIAISLLFQKIDEIKQLSYFSLYIIPMFLIMISFIIMLDSLSKVDNTPGDRMKLSRRNREKLLIYKIFLLVSIVLIIGSLLYSSSKKSLNSPSPDVDVITFTCLIVLYVTSSYTLYYSNDISLVHRSKLNIE
jgi:hypothetical protein